MNIQDAFNIAMGLCGALGGWWLRVMWSALTDLTHEDKKLADKVASIEVLVAGQYIRRDELDRSLTALFTKLDRIEDKLDSKQDKP